MGLDAVRALYRASSAVAEHHDEAKLQTLHVPTHLDGAVTKAVCNGGVIFVTGNPGDGKTHLIRVLKASFDPAVDVCLDANEIDNDVLAARIRTALDDGRTLVVAINEGILVELTALVGQEAWAQDVRAKLLQPLVYGELVAAGDARIAVFDLNLRNVLAREVVQPALDRVLALAQLAEEETLESEAERNLAVLRDQEQVRDRLFDLLETVGRSGVHATMRDLLGFLAYLICGRGEAERGSIQPYYQNAFDGGLGPLFDALRRFDPLSRPMPLLDDVLWRHQDTEADWILPVPEVRRHGYEEGIFPGRKRRAFFEHTLGRGNLEHAGSHVDQQFRSLIEKSSARVMVNRLNRFFDRTENGEDRLHLWLTHRYDAHSSRFAAARWDVPAGQLRVIVPKLGPHLAAAFPGYQPDHVVLAHRSLPPSAGLVIDRRLLEALADVRLGAAASRNGEPASRIKAFYDRLAKVARADSQSSEASPQVMLLDMERAGKVVVGVDLHSRSYVRL